ncbi:MAG: CPBP family intramembrane metalloprotease [Anaerolineae bacterium]|jgi:hypothetical protein|nr:CPBP family intramembrane metalloprotease [Anaerolineae bacterium]
MPVETLFGVLYIGILLYLTNVHLVTQRWLPVILALMNGLLSLMVLLTLMLGHTVLAPTDPARAIPPAAGLLCVTVAALATLAAGLLVHMPAARQALAQVLTRHSGPAVRPLYNPDSWMHTAALLLALLAIVYYGTLFVVSGGLAGLARALEAAPPSLMGVLVDFTTSSLVALLGVGLFLRRDVPATLQRLGLDAPTRYDWLTGAAAGAGLFLMTVPLSLLISSLTPPEVRVQQNAAADALFTAFGGSLLTGLLVALAYGISEEILYRGALQPVFGIGLTTLLFVLLHLQYLFTPSMLILAGVALGLAWLRRNHNTTTAIVAHVVYNALPFLLVGLLPGS